MNNDVPYVLITGHGRSGTNWLLDMLDTSDSTICRNEPDSAQSSLMCELPDYQFVEYLTDDFGELWKTAVYETAFFVGERDRVGQNPKKFASVFWDAVLGRTIYSKRSLRYLFSFLSPSMRNQQWPVPDFYFNRFSIDQALRIYKINQKPDWARWVLNNDDNGKIIHIVRHPGGFLNSWKNRYLKKYGKEKIATVNLKRLSRVVQNEYWAKLIGSTADMRVEESELWYWRYANETIYETGKDNERYHKVVYEELGSVLIND